MKHLELNAEQIEYLRNNMPGVHSLINSYVERQFDNKKDKRMSKGCIIEQFYYLTLKLKYFSSQVIFNNVKSNWQMMNGPDGLPDSGYDIRLSGLTYDYRIDCKWQECLKYDTVDMSLFYEAGHKHFAMSGKATHSAHFYLEYKPVSPVAKKLLRQQNKPIPNDYTLKVVFVDLDKFRQSIKEIDGKYVAGPHTEDRGAVSNDRMLNVTVKWLEESGCAISYTIEA